MVGLNGPRQILTGIMSTPHEQSESHSAQSHHPQHPAAHRPPPQPIPQPVFGEPVFNEGVATPDPTHFLIPHPSDNALYNSLGNTLETNTVSFPVSRVAPGDLYSLATAYGARGPATLQQIQANGKIVFHAVGDTGASAARSYPNQVHVADQLSADFHKSRPVDRPSFFFHLGDVIYNFGESKYYFDQFYEPFRNYPLPVLAIPGNHDSFIVPGTPNAEIPLTIFGHNFCAEHPGITLEAGGLHRTSMTQPGVYFTVDAPFVRIIGLFSNGLEDPGVISSENGRWPNVPDTQLAYLTAQLQRIRTENYSGAVLIAVHHPPFSYTPPGGTASAAAHGSSTAMLRQIDTICNSVGVYPHAVLSGHAHNYQRYTRTLTFAGQTYQVPFVVCGSGGHHINPLVFSTKGQPSPEPAFGTDVSYLEVNPAVAATRLILEKYQDTQFGYLRVVVDARHLQIAFHVLNGTGLHQSQFDVVTVDLATHKLIVG